MPVNIDRILCPVDFSDTSRRALHYAFDMARLRGAEVTVAHVAPRTLPPLSALAAYTSGAVDPGVREGLRRDLLEELRRFVEPIAKGVRVDCIVEEGNVVDTIVALAARADLLVLGSHGHGALEGLILGSVTEATLHKSPCPALTVPPSENAPETPIAFKRILCPLDFSPASEAALPYAVALARETEGRITLLHVIEGLLGEKPVDLPLEVGSYLDSVQERARERLRAALSGDDARWLDGEPLVASGKAHAEILRVAGESGADVVVMGVHGQTALGRVLFGSTARHVVRGAQCPVLTVRPRQD